MSEPNPNAVTPAADAAPPLLGTAAPTAAPIRVVHRHDRDNGMPPRTDTSAVDDVHLTAREKAIMKMLLVAIAPDGTATMLARATLKTSANKMRELYNCGWVNDAGTDDPENSWWWLTTHGEQVIRAIQENEAQ